MSSNIQVKRVCRHCGNEFTARTTTTLYCSHRCNSAAYKANKRAEKLELITKEARKVLMPMDDLKAKEFLTVKETARLLSCSIRSIYYYIEKGSIGAVNIGSRITRVKRSELDKLFEQPRIEAPQPEVIRFDISECYTIGEVRGRFGISEKGIYDIIQRNDIPRFKKGSFVYVPKTIIDKLLN